MRIAVMNLLDRVRPSPFFVEYVEEQLAFSAPRPDHYWQMTWVFALEPLDRKTTRLHVRARAAFPDSARLHAAWLVPIHHLMETVQLHRLRLRAEQRLP